MIASTEREARKVERHAAHVVASSTATVARGQFAMLLRLFLHERGWTYYTARYGTNGRCLTCNETVLCFGVHVLSREAASEVA